MTKKFTYVISAVLLAGMVACGPAASPTLSAADIQLTGVALAWTGLAMTQTAMPSNTPPPAISTQMPTFAPLPTISFGTPTPGLVGPLGSPTMDACTQPPPIKPKGSEALVTFLNKSDGSVTISWAMNAPNSLGECGTYSFSFGVYGSPTEKVMTGCYSAYAWVVGKKNSTAQSIASMCLNDSNKNYSVLVGTEVIKLKP